MVGKSEDMEIKSEIIVCVLLLVLVPTSALEDPITPSQAADLRDEVRDMFYHAFNNYMEHAFPMDELRPLSCSGEESLGEYTLTLVDALDMLALLGDRAKFTEAVTWLGKNLHFNRNKTVSVFETTIRVLGGLLSGHLLASDESTGMKVDGYQNELLKLAEALGRRLLPAFDTPTGIPYGSVNLLHGVSEDESQVTSTAGGGTLTLEFGLLSRLTGDPIFETVAKNAVRGLWAQRSQLGLVGAHINVFTGEWTHKDAGIGTSIDSFYEYLLKAYLLFGDDEYLYMFKEAYKSVMTYLYTDPWYWEVNMNSAVVVWPLFNSLQAFWPGLQVLAGDVDPAMRTHKAFFAVWKKYGFTPEGFNLATQGVQPGQRSYPLRPELIESTYMLYKATADPHYLEVGRDITASIQFYARCPCGYCHIGDVETRVQEDHMESFFLAETVKYLWLLFDLAAGGDNLVETGPHLYIFSTEGHLFPMTPEIALRSDYKLVPTFLHENVPDAGQLGDEDKGTTFAEPHIPRLFNSLISRVNKSGFGLDMDCTDESDLAYRPLEGICQKLSMWRKLAAFYLAGLPRMEEKQATEGEPTDFKEINANSVKSSRETKFIRDLLVSIVHVREEPQVVSQEAEDTLPLDKAEGIRVNLITELTPEYEAVEVVQTFQKATESSVDSGLNLEDEDAEGVQPFQKATESSGDSEVNLEDEDAEGVQPFQKATEVSVVVVEDIVENQDVDGVQRFSSVELSTRIQ
ncbi:ER degradation enhancer, mannosidase alpha-like 2 [Marchantia polymorpha subsp. ruderalis]